MVKEEKEKEGEEASNSVQGLAKVEWMDSDASRFCNIYRPLETCWCVH